MIDLAGHDATVERDLGGCPVMHRDFSGAQPAGCHWALADELRETGPVFFNTFAQGYWVFTRHDAVRDIYKTPELFSSESITPWQPDPIYRFVPTQIDAPDHIKYRRIVNPWFSPRNMDAAEARMRGLCRRLVEDLAASGGCDFVTGFALRFPTEAFLSVIGIDPADADLFVPWVEDFFGGFGGDPEGLEPMAKALEGIREYWVAALAERRADPAPREGDFASHLLHSTFDERPLTDAEMLDMLTVLVLAGLDTTRATLGYMFRHLADASRAPPAPDRRAGADPVRRRGVPAPVHDHLRRRPQSDARHRVPRRPAQAGRHGLRARVGRQPRSARVRARGRVRDRSQAQPAHGLRERPAPLPRAPTSRGANCSSRSRSGCALSPTSASPPRTSCSERGGGAMMTLTTLPLAWEVPS